MGFMDKAKKMAEQAQQKVEEKQTQFNASQAQKAQAGASGGATFDSHGRPVPPAAGGPGPLASDPTAPLSGGDPVGSPPVGDTATAEPPAPVQTTEPTEDPALKPGVNKSPDPFKPIG
jgi:hypothetical protein